MHCYRVLFLLLGIVCYHWQCSTVPEPTVFNDPPQLAVSPDHLDFGETRNNSIITLRNVGTGTMQFSIESPQGWVQVGQSQGNIPTNG